MKKPLTKVLKNLDAKIEIAEEEFHCPGSFGRMHAGRPNESDLTDVKAFAKQFVEK